MFIFNVHVSDPVTGDSRTVRMMSEEATFDAAAWVRSFPDVAALVMQLKDGAVTNPVRDLSH